jgi:hypothetical protein
VCYCECSSKPGGNKCNVLYQLVVSDDDDDDDDGDDAN